MTLNELFDIYIEDVDMINQVTTTDSIKYRYKSHLKPVFGNIELEAIDPKSIKKFQKDMVEGVYRSRLPLVPPRLIFLGILKISFFAIYLRFKRRLKVSCNI